MYIIYENLFTFVANYWDIIKVCRHQYENWWISGYTQMTETCVKTRLCQTLCPPTLRQQQASWPVIAGRARVVTAGRGWPGSSSWAHLVPWVDFSQSWARPWGGHQQAEDSQWSVSHWLTWHLISDKHVNIHKVTLHIAAQSEGKNQVIKSISSQVFQWRNESWFDPQLQLRDMCSCDVWYYLMVVTLPMITLSSLRFMWQWYDDTRTTCWQKL